jgi:hypothetical protein
MRDFHLLIPTERLARPRGTLVFEYINALTGQRRYEIDHNLITDAHRATYANWLVGDAPASPDYLALGTGALAQYAETNQDATIDLTSSGADQQLAQEFIAAGSGTEYVKSIWLYLRRVGSSAGTLTAEIQTNAAGLPSGTAITNGASTTVTINLVGTSYDWVAFSFATPPLITLGTIYHIVLKSSGYTYSNGVTEINVGVDQSAPGYASGDFETYNGVSWTSYGTPSDASFRVISEPQASDTALVGETTRKQLTSKIAGPTTARLLANFTTTQANNTHGEAALFDLASGGTMFSIVAIKHKKTSAESLNVYWIFSIP